MARTSRSAELARVNGAIAGIQKYFSTTASVVLAGTTYTPAQLTSLLQAYADAIQALIGLHAQLRASVGAVTAEGEAVDKILLALASYVDNLFGSDPGKLADFGMKPRKVAVVSAQTKVLAQAKSKATRLARHTMGSKQKASIHGTVTTSEPAGSSPQATNGTAQKM